MPITKIYDTKDIEKSNPFIKKLRNDHGVLFKYDDKFIIFFNDYSCRDTLFFSIMNDLNSLSDFDINNLKNEELCKNADIIPIKFGQHKYYANTCFIGMSAYYITSYDDNSIWLINKYNSEMIYIDFKTRTKVKGFFNERVDSLEFVYGKYFIMRTDETKNKLYDMDLADVIPSEHIKLQKSLNNKKIYKWDQFCYEKEKKEFVYIKEDDCDVNYFAINWKGYTIAKIKDYIITFMNDNLEEFESIDCKDFFNYKPMIPLCCDEHSCFVGREHFQKFVTINDNCLFYYETCDLIDTKHWIICNGLENNYCFDFTTNKQIYFKNKSLDFFSSSGIPFRENDKVRLLMYEWYPAGSWTNVYDSE